MVGLGSPGAVVKAASTVRDDEINDEEDEMDTSWARRLRNERAGLIEYMRRIG